MIPDDPVEHAHRVLDRVERWEPRVHAYLSLRPRGEVLRETREAARRIREGRARRLEGLLVAVKDNIVTLGLPTTAGSLMLRGWRPGFEATVVKRLRREGAIILGKTNLDEFAMGSTTELSAYGPTRNPLDPERVPGGSSGGSAAALAYGGADLALGSDTGGSVRLPAAYTGTVGLKPTYGAVSRYGLIPYANSLEQIGPMARSVREAWTLYTVIAGWDPRDSTTRRWSPPPEPPRLEPRDLRVCVPREMTENADSGVLDRLWRVLRVLEEGGARVEEASLPDAPRGLAAYYIIAMAEAASNLARYDGSLTPCTSPEARGWRELNIEARTRCLGPEVKRRILMGTYVLSRGYRRMLYARATVLRRRIRDSLLRLTRDCLVASPTSPVPPPRLGERIGDPLRLYALDIMTVTANLAGLPAISIPGPPLQGVPVGIQLVGPPLGEPLLAAAGMLVEEAVGRGGEG